MLNISLVCLKSFHLESALLQRSKRRDNQALGCQMGYKLVPRVHSRIYTCLICHKPCSWHILPVFHCFTLLSLHIATSFKNNWMPYLGVKISFKVCKESQINLPELCFHLLSKTEKNAAFSIELSSFPSFPSCISDLFIKTFMCKWYSSIIYFLFHYSSFDG